MTPPVSQSNWSRLGAWIWSRTRIFSEREPEAGAYRAQQLAAVIRLMPLVVFANVTNSLIVAWEFWSDASQAFLTAWVLLVTLIAANGLPTWLRWRSGRLGKSVSPRVERRAIVHAGVLGAVWGAMPTVLLSLGNEHEELVVWLVTYGMLASGSFALGVMPRAGSAYVLMMTAGAAIGLLGADDHACAMMGLLLALFASFSLIAVWSSGRFFGERLTAQARSDRQAQVVSLLLRDFEENASDLLWETGPHGRLVSSPRRIAAALRLSPDEVTAQPLVQLLATLAGSHPGTEREERLQALLAALHKRVPFRDLLVQLGTPERPMWLSVTAKPKFNDMGEYEGWRGLATDVTRTQHANEQLRFMAHHDPLTGLPNRAHFRDLARAALAQEASGACRPSAMICFDLDHFKNTNDTLGQAAGDTLLMEVARRLTACTRRGDLIAHLGGDEFAALMVGVQDEDGVTVLAERLMDALQKPVQIQGLPVPVRLSMGLALAPRDGEQVDVLMNHADLALHEAKAAGRATWRRFAAHIAQHTRRRAQLEQALRDAVAQRQLWLAYQPKVDLSSGRVIGFEALLRWTHPELGPISPAEFIPIAEASGLIVPIGAWVLGEALTAASQWPGELSVAVNVSPSQAVSEDFVRTVRHALDVRDFAPRRLELEITESIFINEGEAATAVLRELRGLGARIALDDFGTGYSSLAYLRNFPFDTLKIDRSFMRELLTREDARHIVDTILRLAHQLKMNTVAEGIEELAQIGALREHGCQIGQGFWLAKPMPETEIAGFLAGWAASPAGRALLPPQQGLALVA